MDQIYRIYVLKDPNTNEVRYVGLTFNTLHQRLKSHMSEPGTSHKTNWIKSLKSTGKKPIIESIEENISSHEKACEREIYHIQNMKASGYNLTNSASGGNKNKKMSEETRLKMSTSAKRRTFKLKLSEEVKDVISKKQKVRMESAEEREKIRIRNKEYESSKTRYQKIDDIKLQKNRKEIIQYSEEMEKINEFISIRDACRLTGFDRSNIVKCCKGQTKSAYGFIWKFK